MNRNHSRLKCCGLYILGTSLFLTAQASVVSGSRLHFSYPTRISFCILAILSIALGTTAWKPQRRLGTAIRFLLAAFLIAAILFPGFKDNRIAAAFPFLPTT